MCLVLLALNKSDVNNGNMSSVSYVNYTTQGLQGPEQSHAQS